jgi:hypothetical protein
VLFHKMPRVAFKMSHEVMAGDARQLSGRLHADLSKHFETAAPERVPRWWVFDAQSGRDRFYIATKRSDKRADLWIVAVDAGGLREVLARRRSGNAQPLYANAWPICREIHRHLAATPGISEIRWYLKHVRKAFATPEGLFEDKYRQEGWDTRVNGVSGGDRGDA